MHNVIYNYRKQIIIIGMDEVFYTIGEFADFFKVSTNTLRHYDKKGIFRPGYVDCDSKHRFYSKNQIKYFQMLLLLKEMGFSLDKIKNLKLEEHLDETEKIFKEEVEEITKKINELREKKDELIQWLRLIDFLKVNKSGDNDVKLVMRKDLRVVFNRKKTSFDVTKITKMFQELNSISKINHVKSYEFYMGVYYDDFEVIKDINDFELCRRVDDTAENEKYDFIRIMPGGLYASIIHKGSYAALINSYLKLKNWIKENNYTIIGPLYAIYIMPEAMVEAKENAETQLILKIENKTL